MPARLFTFARWMNAIEVTADLSYPLSLSFSLAFLLPSPFPLPLHFPLAAFTFTFMVPFPFKHSGSVCLTFARPFSVSFPGPVSFFLVEWWGLDITASCISRVTYRRTRPHIRVRSRD